VRCAVEVQVCDRDGELEAAWTGAARIQVEDTVADLDRRLVRVSVEDNCDPSRLRLEVEVCE
jgi:hypothetical protein